MTVKDDPTAAEEEAEHFLNLLQKAVQPSAVEECPKGGSEWAIATQRQAVEAPAFDGDVAPSQQLNAAAASALVRCCCFSHSVGSVRYQHHHRTLWEVRRAL